MSNSTEREIITIDGVEYAMSELGENTRNQIANIQFVESQIQQLNNEWAIADTARIAYTSALKRELTSIK